MMHCFFRSGVSIGKSVCLSSIRFCLCTGMPGWAGHGFGVVSVSESVSVMGSETIVGFVNGSSWCDL
jgi:hypothetical protein